MSTGKEIRYKSEYDFTFANYPVDNYRFIFKISTVLQELNILKLLLEKALFLHQQQYNLCIIPVYVSILSEKHLRVILQTSLKIVLL